MVVKQLNGGYKTDFDKHGFAGNSGHCRFIKPYADAHDQAIIETGSYFWAEIEGMKAMSIHYGFDRVAKALVLLPCTSM